MTPEEKIERLEMQHMNEIAQLEQEIRMVRARNERLEAEALDMMVAENQRLGLYDDGPAVKTYCGGKPNYCTTQEPEYVIDCPRCGHCCPERKWVGLADYTNQVANGRMRIDAETGDVCIGTPSTPAQRTWVGLTDDDIWEGYSKTDSLQYIAYAKAIEAKLKAKNI